jgi:hypothetical protein
MQGFTRGECYSRREIAEVVGGGQIEYLPMEKGEVVCGCFRTDLNPGAPETILPGNGSQIIASARQFREQTRAVPVFLKRGVGAWEYVGDYRVKSWSDDPASIVVAQTQSGRSDVTMVLRLERVG